MNSNSGNTGKTVRLALVVPHIFMHRRLLPHVIFSPGEQALALASNLQQHNVDVTLCTPGPVDTTVHNLTASLDYFDAELARRGDSYMDLLRKHPFTFVTLARQVQSELIADVFKRANDGEFDLVHIYTNEEEIALPFAALCRKPVVFTHHDPFNFLVKYKNNFPKYKSLRWLSLSYAQRHGMPKDTNWAGNIYHGLDAAELTPVDAPTNDYVAYMGRIIEPKGVHLAIAALQHYNQSAATPLRLRIAGKHYAEVSKDTYWREKIEPCLNDPAITYDGFIGDNAAKQAFLANARALLVPSLFDEPFGMVSLEAFACGTPVIALDSGALPEVVQHGKTGIVVAKRYTDNGELDEPSTIARLASAIDEIAHIDRAACRQVYETTFTADHMAAEHARVYRDIIAQTN
ncbi:hypothetical protein CSA80_01295 [Candidatus Saccharibacteria bacterium]|nr:MAG: hypothetical protein CSA80_01295 [Candidatus Saccharibacteria bacterium]